MGDASKTITIRKSTIDDVKEIHKLVNVFARRDEMLPRPLSEIYENVRDFLVYEEGDRIVSCAALHVVWEDLAEIRSLAVNEEDHNRGIGSALVRECLKEARSLGINRVFVLTYEPVFFEQLGFSPYPKEELPHKIWSDCIRCPKFPDCDESALIIKIE